MWKNKTNGRLLMENNTKDVAFIQDFLFFLENSIALENHCLQSFGETNDKIQLQLAEKIREIRSKIMYRIISESRNQSWCEVKHLAGVCMSLRELGNRYLTDGKKDLAEECYKDSNYLEGAIILLIGKEEKNGVQ